MCQLDDALTALFQMDRHLVCFQRALGGARLLLPVQVSVPSSQGSVFVEPRPKWIEPAVERLVAPIASCGVVGAAANQFASVEILIEQQVPALCRPNPLPFTRQQGDSLVPCPLATREATSGFLTVVDAAVHHVPVDQRERDHVLLSSTLTKRIRSRALTCLCGQPTARKTSGGAEESVLTPCGYSAGMKIVSPVPTQ